MRIILTRLHLYVIFGIFAAITVQSLFHLIGNFYQKSVYGFRILILSITLMLGCPFHCFIMVRLLFEVILVLFKYFLKYKRLLARLLSLYVV